MADDSDDLAVLLNSIKVLFNALLAIFICPLLGRFRESLLLWLTPSRTNQKWVHGRCGEKTIEGGTEPHQWTVSERRFSTLWATMVRCAPQESKLNHNRTLSLLTARNLSSLAALSTGYFLHLFYFTASATRYNGTCIIPMVSSQQ